MLVNKSLPRRLVHGFVYQYTRNSGNPNTSRRWAYIDGDNLFLFPDSLNSSRCYRIYLKDTTISIINEKVESPWITITEKNMVTYFIQPEKMQYFDSWLATLKRASNNLLKFAPSSGTSPLSGLPPRSTNGRTSSKVFRSSMERENGLLAGENNSENQSNHSSSMTSTDRAIRPIPYTSHKLSHRNEHQSVGTNSSIIGSGAPPRPPRSSATLHAIKECQQMSDTDVNMDKPFYNIPSQYPDSGPAKRMSITASDLRGKSRDELMLLLLQLNREKANLQRWLDYFMQRIQVLNDPTSNNSTNDEDIAAMQVELNDVSEQLALSEPLVAFLSNMLRMGDLYAGDDAMFASEYRKHLLNEEDLIPAKSSLVLARDLEARDIARTLNASVQDFTGSTNPTHQLTDMAAIGNSLAGWLDHNQILQHGENPMAIQTLGRSLPQLKFQETEETRQERLRLETELSDLETICNSHGTLHRQLRDVQTSLRQYNTLKGNEPTSSTVDRRGPSATLLSKLQSDPGYHPARSRSSDQRHSIRSPALFVNSNFNQQTGFGRQSAGTDKKLLNSANASTRRNNLRRFQSIPENLNLISQSANRLAKDNTVTNLSSTTQGSTETTPRQLKSESRANASQGSRQGTSLQPNAFPGPLHVDTFQSQPTNGMKEASSLRPSVKPRTSSLKLVPGSSTSLRSGDLQVNSTEYRNQNVSPSSTPSDDSPTEDLSLDDTVNKKGTTSWKPSSEMQQVREAHNSLRSLEHSRSQQGTTKQSSSMQRSEHLHEFTEESIESVFY